ncbi:MAG: hypothetical protein IT384_34930 [Deltaproteobacteria bacterium]|nr:hypothetical protein [Deltaproteobacteria bacterium]
MAPADLAALEAEVVQKHGVAQKPRIARGLKQVAALWRAEDGDLAAFVREHFIAEQPALDATFARLEAIFEQLDGHMNEVGRELRRATDTDIGPLLGVDPLLAAMDPSAHLTEDLFRAKIGFVALLNFPLATLEEKTHEGPKWSRRQWAEVRLAQRFARRVPAEIQQAVAKAGAEADLYIAEYNIWMHHLVGNDGKRLFPSGLRLISHWNLRDELKAAYSDPAGLPKQQMIVQVMERIVTQSIPAVVINNPHVDWNPFSNEVRPAPAEAIEKDAPPAPSLALGSAPEPDVRYAKLLAQYQAARRADPYSPIAPTQIARSYELGRELPEARVKALLIEVLTSPLVPKVAREIEQRLGRKLEPADLWFSGFKARAGKKESDLDAITKKRYPSAAAFAAEMPKILEKLGFSSARARYLSERIKIDPSRGAGHAMPSLRRGDFPRLRTRVEKDGMNYKGYNIAVHELGHNVEQVFSLYDVDHTLLQGVPNNAFTEALAFVFQARDLELLGLAKPNPESERMRVLADFWATWEIAGVALVDNAVWHWMYDHPNATPAELRAATVEIAKSTWNQYYAPVLGGPDRVLLGVYSHMVAYPLYLADYPLGHLIAFQIEERVKKSKKLGDEFERMAKQGAVIPDLWMQGASGEPVSAGPLLRATEAALSLTGGPTPSAKSAAH